MEEEKRCPVCYEQIEEFAFSLLCGHELHLQCYNELLLSQNNKCPVCNEIINNSSSFDAQQLHQVNDLRELNLRMGLNPLNLIFELLQNQMNEEDEYEDEEESQEEYIDDLNFQYQDQIPMMSVDALLQVIRHTTSQVRNRELKGVMIQDMISTFMDFMSPDEIELLMVGIDDIFQE